MRKLDSMNNKPDCQICFEKVEWKDIIPLDCGHIYHTECMEGLISAAVTSKTFPIKCPDLNCQQELSEGEIKHFINEELYQKYLSFQLDFFVEHNAGTFINCATPDCEYVFEWGTESKENQRFRCNLCDKEYCINCRVKWHEELTCAEFKEMEDIPEEDRLFFKVVKSEKMKQCTKCKFWV
jgi:E3 ubiquitin-protein ligase RNF144